ncbi:MAG: TlpA family protein disulfide reductase, partial [Kaistella sp.]
VKDFAEENNLSKHIVLVDGQNLAPEFFSKNFQQWDGGSIPFTFMRKGDKTDETIGMMSKEMLDEKINSFR